MKRSRKPKWSFVVIRGAEQSVKQFRVSKRSMVAAPAAALLAVSGCFAGFQLKAAYQTRELRDEITRQSALYAETVEAKEKTIAALQQNVVSLSAQSQEVNKKLEELQELEGKLEQFIEKYGSRINASSPEQNNAASSSAGVPLSLGSGNGSANAAFGSSSYAGDTKRIAALAYSADADLRALSGMVDAMEQTMQQTLQRAITVRAVADAYPSEWPTRSRLLTSSFGYREDPFNGTAKFHAGIDIAGTSDDPVFSAADGTVVETGSGGSEGNFVTVDHGNSLKTIYMHLSKIGVKEGDAVVRGEKIGLMGSTGRSTGTHLHFQIMANGKAVNPLPYLNGPSS